MEAEVMGLIDFQRKFSSEDACLVQLKHLRWPEGFRCPRCGHDKAYILRARRLFQCQACKHQASLTAGTIFHKTRVPLVKWFWMIFLMTRSKSGISVQSMQRMLEIKSYKTAWMMAHKIRKGLADRDARYTLRGVVEVDDAYFGGARSGPAGRGAKGKTKVVVAVETHGTRAGFATMRTVETLEGAAIVDSLKGKLEAGTVARTDGLRSYRALAASGVRHQPEVVGDGPNAVKLFPWVHILISNAKGNIRGVHHGVSDKHLQRYLSEFCYRFNRRYIEKQLFNRSLRACLSTPTITYAELSQ